MLLLAPQALFIVCTVLIYALVTRTVLRTLDSDIKAYKRSLLLLPPELVDVIPDVKAAAFAAMEEAGQA